VCGDGGALVVSEDFSSHPNEYPNTLDMPPSGSFFVAETDEPVAGYAITDSKFEFLRKIPIVLSATGEPVCCAVSLFSFLFLCVPMRVVGTPERMILNDHIANITDSPLFSCAIDTGTVYE
jgi:hypothetical protein